ncbi:hypothetical protein VTK56DRAFT_8312 [Thermocarpiscus australiensis]
MSSISLRKLGKNGPAVPAVGLGLFGLGIPVYRAVGSEDARLAILDRAYELGARFWDSSDFYGEADQLISKWINGTGKRNDIFVATKFGYIPNTPTYDVDGSYQYARRCCIERLEVLGVDSIDLLYLHAINAETPIEQTMRALAELKAEGKIKNIGLSNVGSTDLRWAVKIAPVACVQVEYSAFTRDIETDRGTNLLATCREPGVAVVAYSPLGRGMLTTTFTSNDIKFEDGDLRKSLFPRFQEENRDHNVGILALAWLLAQGDDISVIPGTKKISS